MVVAVPRDEFIHGLFHGLVGGVPEEPSRLGNVHAEIHGQGSHAIDGEGGLTVPIQPTGVPFHETRHGQHNGQGMDLETGVSPILKGLVEKGQSAMGSPLEMLYV